VLHRALPQNLRSAKMKILVEVAHQLPSRNRARKWIRANGEPLADKYQNKRGDDAGFSDSHLFLLREKSFSGFPLSLVYAEE
jgi:hypothetical protein